MIEDNNLDLKNKIAVITGGSSGIGKAITISLAKFGVKVAVCSLSQKELDDLEKKLRQIYQHNNLEDQYFLKVVDITSLTKLKSFALEVENNLGILGILVANAGVTDQKHHKLVDVPPTIWKKVINVNLTGTFYTLKTFLPKIEKSIGNVIIISSLLGQEGGGKANDAPYCASKFGIEGLAEVASKEFKDKGVNINTVYPGSKVNTEFFSYLTKEERKKLVNPEVIVEPVLFLVSLLPGSLTNISIDSKRWRGEKAYRKAICDLAYN